MKSRLLAVTAAAALFVGCGASTPQTFLTVLTGNTSGVYYPLGVALSQVFRTAIPEANVSVQSTAASAENKYVTGQCVGELDCIGNLVASPFSLNRGGN